MEFIFWDLQFIAKKNVVESRGSTDGSRPFAQALTTMGSRNWHDVVWMLIFLAHLILIGFTLGYFELKRFRKVRLNVNMYKVDLTEDFWPLYAVAGGVGTLLGWTWLLWFGSHANQVTKFSMHLLAIYLAVISVLCFGGEQLFWGAAFGIAAAFQFLYVISVIDRLPFTMLVLEKSSEDGMGYS
ncbi:Peptide deformylase 1B, chloroplastic [Olea europaea subsp. europaea]|uniref:Peptide deformylase 1B, chloroplastic n=1 Tax=Olea europaea subsp. europaea TaxID=158383 RepID=A0A8S0SMR4_OLEEU|nr:Peptide deformylase 1B, chloroplastic [Olea europaea subsp. europaea]